MVTKGDKAGFLDSLLRQLREDTVALISLAIAVSSLSYSSWRDELTERNRNYRAAGFELLSKLAEFERVVFLAHYDRDPSNGNPRTGWSEIIVINDLAQILPPPLSERAAALRTSWRENWEALGQDDEKPVDNVEADLTRLRNATLEQLRSLK